MNEPVPTSGTCRAGWYRHIHSVSSVFKSDSIENTGKIKNIKVMSKIVS